MKKSTKIILLFGLIALLTVAIVMTANAVSGAAFTTFNPWVDGEFRDVCKNSIINCNIYGSKPDVWLNGGPIANGLGPDGEYFFAVLVPGGQPDPNDGGKKNLSDDYDAYTNRTFTITDGEVSFYGGDHDQDSGNFIDPDREFCTSKRGCDPDGFPPLIRLYPYADTTNPGGVYILAICSLGDGYPVEPRDCKYDAFKVKEGPMRYSFMIDGMKFKDLDANGVYDNGDFGLEGWEITIYGNGFDGELIDTSVFTDENGYWSFGKDYSFNSNDTPVAAELTICEEFPAGEVWYQSLPGGDGCYEIILEPAAMAYWNLYPLDFGNFQEELTVTKTADTSYTREHFWDIAKKVETAEYDFFEFGSPKIWLFVDGRFDDTATWTIDVTYEGSSDYGHNVSGDITISNTGTVTATITAVDDVLGGTPITVDCGVDFPYDLTGGNTLTCTYDEDGEFTGENVATVTTKRNTYSGSADIIWGDPTTEINKTINIQDISDLFGTQNFGPLTAPDDAQFTYTKAFTWADPYSADNCGHFQYDNTATIVETEQSASATLMVNVQCYDYESAWAEGSGAGVTAEPFCDTFSNWGWTNEIGPGSYTGWTLWAGAGQCDPTKGLDVGTVDVEYFLDSEGYYYVEVTYNVDPPYYIKETHVYVDYEPFPFNASGPTTAPGQYYNASPFDGEPVYVIAHAVVGIPDPDFGPLP